MALFLYPSVSSSISSLEKSYAESLASTAAKRGVDAALHHDLVSLQLILKDITSNPRVLIANIHDVENQLLVQSGSGFYPPDQVIEATAPITLHDSIAGHVTVLTERSNVASAFGWFTLAATLLAFLTFLWSSRNRDVFERPSSALPITNDDEDGVVGEADADEQATPVTNIRCFCHLYLHNMAVLEQQLNQDKFYATLNQLEQNIIDVMTLYGGQNFDRVDDHYILTFQANENIEELAFRATCCAYLLRSTSSIINDIPLDLGFLISDISGKRSDAAEPNMRTAAIVIDSSISMIDELHSRFTLIDLDDNSELTVLTDVKSPYLTLLENQRRQLCLDSDKSC